MKKAIAVLLCVLLLGSVLAGCTGRQTNPSGGETTARPQESAAPETTVPVGEMSPANLAAEAARRMQKLDSVRMKMLVEIQVAMSQEGMDLNFTMTGDVEIESVREPAASHTKGTLSMMGMSFPTDTYVVREGNATVSYEWDSDRNAFIRTVDTTGESAESFFTDDMELASDSWTMEETADAYVLTGTLKGDAFSSLSGEALGEMMGSEEGEGEAAVPAVVTVDKQTLYIRSISVDMGNQASSFLGLGELTDDGSMSMELSFSDYNAVGPIQPPSEYIDGSGEITDPVTPDEPVNVDPVITDPVTPQNVRAPEDFTDAELAEVHPMLFRVTGKNGTQMYLFGTIHVGDGRTEYALERLSPMLDSCDALAVEFDTKAFAEDFSAQLNMTMEFMLTDGTTIRDHMPADLYARAAALLNEAGLMPDLMGSFSIGMWYSLVEDAILLTRSDLSADYGMDTALIEHCYEKKTEVRDVESAEFQYGLLAGFSDELYVLLIESMLDGVDTAREDNNELYAAWLDGDYDAILALCTEEGDVSDYTDAQIALLEDFNRQMLTDRNLGMRDRALEWINAGDRIFFAVGAAHLVGEGGLVELLRAAGCTVERVNYAN